MSGHTPGPWTFQLARWTSDSPSVGFSIYANNERDGMRRSVVSANVAERYAFTAFYTPDETEANARLICAAPDMLATLKEALAFIKDEIDYGAGTFDAEARAALSNRIAAVIKQAEGEP